MAKPLFSPRSVFWRVNRELACGMAAPRAVLMQIAHPLVAAGVDEHSNFRRHRLARLYRTSMAAAAITFGSSEFAHRAVESIDRKHRKVHGVLKTSAGAFAAGTPYNANDPELKLWVLNTITDSTLLFYDTFVARLSWDDRSRYYDDSLIAGDLFGIPRSIVPPTYGDFLHYMENMLSSDAICVSREAWGIARALFSPTPSGILLLAGSAASIILLPERLRREFGFDRYLPRRDWLRPIPSLCRGLRRYTPGILCANPAATLSQLVLSTGKS